MEAEGELLWLEAHNYAADFGAASERAFRETRNFLRQRWPAINRVAEALRRAGRLYALDVVRLADPAGAAEADSFGKGR